MMAVPNDCGCTRVFVRQIEALGQRGGVTLGISTSGESPRVVAALAASRERGLVTVALTGRDGAADIHLNVPDATTPRVQEVHRTVLHVLCSLIDLHLRKAEATDV